MLQFTPGTSKSEVAFTPQMASDFQQMGHNSRHRSLPQQGMGLLPGPRGDFLTLHTNQVPTEGLPHVTKETELSQAELPSAE